MRGYLVGGFGRRGSFRNPLVAFPRTPRRLRDNLPVFAFARTRIAGLGLFALAVPPILRARDRPPDRTAGPYQVERQEQPPGIVPVGDGPRDQFARPRGGVEPMAAEAACEPQARRKLADLRHPVERIAEHAGPDVFDLDLTKLRIDVGD